jgi:hypothetical protein
MQLRFISYFNSHLIADITLPFRGMERHSTFYHPTGYNSGRFCLRAKYTGECRIHLREKLPTAEPVDRFIFIRSGFIPHIAKPGFEIGILGK